LSKVNFCFSIEGLKTAFIFIRLDLGGGSRAEVLLSSYDRIVAAFFPLNWEKQKIQVTKYALFHRLPTAFGLFRGE